MAAVRSRTPHSPFSANASTTRSQRSIGLSLALQRPAVIGRVPPRVAGGRGSGALDSAASRFLNCRQFELNETSVPFYSSGGQVARVTYRRALVGTGTDAVCFHGRSVQIGRA